MQCVAYSVFYGILLDVSMGGDVVQDPAQVIFIISVKIPTVPSLWSF